jgi:hypothetical protein
VVPRLEILMDIFAELQRWYEAQCNGDWEHHNGITIESCDNPGWWVKIDLADTSLINRELRLLCVAMSLGTWIQNLHGCMLH